MVHWKVVLTQKVLERKWWVGGGGGGGGKLCHLRSSEKKDIYGQYAFQKVASAAHGEWE